MSAPPPTRVPYLVERAERDWLRVKAVPNGNGWDVVLVVDGTYTEGCELVDKMEMCRYVAEEISVDLGVNVLVSPPAKPGKWSR